MGVAIGGMRWVIEGILTPFDWMGPFWGLTLLSALVGVAILYLVSWTTPQRLVTRSQARMASAIYEIRLFLDSPKRVLISIGRLLVSSIVYIATMLPALVIMSIPLWLMYLHLEPRHGLQPLRVGEPIVVEVEYQKELEPSTFEITSDDTVTLDLPPVISPSEHKLYLRVVPNKPAISTLSFGAVSDQVDKKLVSAANEKAQPQRASGLTLLDSIGTEPGLNPRQGIVAISVPHEPSHQNWLGLPIPWWVYSLAIVTLAALALKKRLGVAL